MCLPVSARHRAARLCLIVSGCLFIAVFLVCPGRLNADIIISDETTGTNGSITYPDNPFILGENETLTVQAGGAITAAGLNSFAIYAGGTGEGGNTITLESGSFVENTLAWDYFSGAGIRIKGDERDDDIFGLTGNGPLDNGASNIVSISAGARLSTNSAYGIRADNNNYISQNGTLSTSGNFISGIHVNDNNEIQMSGSLTATGGTGIYANRNNFIDISGAVNSSGTNGAGIIVYQHNDITVTGTVETTGSEFPGTLGDQCSAGIYGETENTINISGTIRTSGSGSDAMEVNDGNTINMSGKIITEGSGSGSAFDRGYTYSDDGGFIIWDSSMINRGYGIKGDDHNTITVDGTIETFGDFAGGLYAYRNNIIDISGEINTYGRESEAVIINSDNQIIADGRLHTRGEGSGGIHADWGNNYIILSGAVITEGEKADGIFADLGSTIEITDTGVIETFGEDASAIYTKGPTTIDMAGNISTWGDSTQSIYSRGTGTINVSGTINHEGFGGAGILAFYADEVNISGDINVTGNSFGINALDVTSITVSGSIETDGNYAIVTDQTEEINISGSVKTHGTYGYAVDTADRINLSGSIVTYGKQGCGLNAGNNFASISGSISTWGEGATAIDAGADASVTLSGYAGTSGSQAHALLARNKNIINVSGILETSGEAADGIRLYGGGNVVYLTGLLSSTGPDGYALNSNVPVYFPLVDIILPGTEEDEISESQAYYTQNVVHLLNGASVNGGIINSTTTDHNSFLTFGYAVNMDGTADLSGVDQDFNLTMISGITSTTADGWKGYFAGGTTTLKGSTNQFSDLFIGSSTFDGARIPAGSGGETTLDALDGPGANLKVTQAVSTTGNVAVGKNSRYTLSGTHTHTGGDIQIDGTLSLASGTLDSTSAIVNTGRIAGNGDITASTLSNTGEMEFTQGRSTVRGNTTNAGTILNNGGEVHFKGDYLEQGTFYSDQGDTYMDNITVDENGALIADGSDPEALVRFFIAGDFLNYSTRTTEWDTINAMLTFTGGDNGIHNFFSVGVETVSALDGFNDNFAWGYLTLGDDVEMLFLLDGNEDNKSTAFYTEIITGIKFNGQGQIINVCGDMNLYYLADLDGNDYLGGISYDFATGTGQLIAVSGVSAVPIPGSLMFLLSGLLVAAWQRR